MKVDSLKIYNRCDYVPLVSALPNFITLVAKVIFYFQSTANVDPKSFKAHVINKSTSRCLALIFLPVISNIVFAIYDYKCKQKILRISELTPSSSGALIKQTGVFDNLEGFESFRIKYPKLESDKIQGDSDEYPWIDSRDMSSAIMQGEDQFGRKFMAFNLIITIPPKYKIDLPVAEVDEQENTIERRVIILFQRDSKDTNFWTASYPGWILPAVPFAPGDSLFKESSRFAPLLDLFDTGSFTYKDCIFALRNKAQ